MRFGHFPTYETIGGEQFHTGFRQGVLVNGKPYFAKSLILPVAIGIAAVLATSSIVRPHEKTRTDFQSVAFQLNQPQMGVRALYAIYFPALNR